ncbi:hypothetical protein Q8791_11455 [Nocardiopsis sp. CT-R113]|uniref:Integral membrane protein n=1 Tax=Nocardiopsis codii TaxID=3065942 RepID=A0ABU7K6F3_9ACTN|nr:hypothetical protein [Nocardiopsis sp. CT-R113]MEE2037835.1 hypothetical protein [Nocardiopsis sp. CT-R113]
MSEDVIRPRPVVDPSLPEELREEVTWQARAPDRFPRRYDTEAAGRRARLREGGVQLLGVGFTTALALFTAGWYLGMVIVSISLVAYVVALACRGDAHPAVRAAGALVGVGTAATTPAWLMEVVPQDPFPGMPWVLFGVLVAMVAVDSLTARAGQTVQGPRQQFVVLPDDLAETDRALLGEVQRTIDLVSDARTDLGAEALDTDRAVAVLRDQEWRIASLLSRQRELRRAHLRRWQRAVSPRVREALRPQREHLGAVEEAVRARVAQITAYGALVEQAVAAHREWEQCQEAVDSNADYVDHLVSAGCLGTASADVSALSDTAESARRVRDERVERVLMSDRLLTGPG